MLTLLKGKAKRLLSVISMVTVLVLIATTLGIPLSQHLCGGKVVSQKIYGSSTLCAMGTAHISNGELSLSALPCCDTKNELQAVKDIDNDGPSYTSPSASTNFDYIALPVSSEWIPRSKAVSEFRNILSPPLLQRDIVLEFRAILI